MFSYIYIGNIAFYNIYNYILYTTTFDIVYNFMFFWEYDPAKGYWT